MEQNNIKKGSMLAHLSNKAESFGSHRNSDSSINNWTKFWLTLDQWAQQPTPDKWKMAEYPVPPEWLLLTKVDAQKQVSLEYTPKFTEFQVHQGWP